MTSDVLLSGKNVEEIFGYQWDDFSKKVSPDLQFLNENWYSTWENKYLPRLNPGSQVKYLSLFDGGNNLQGTFPYVEFSRFGLKILSAAGLYYPFRSILFSSEFPSDCAAAFVRTIDGGYRNNIIRIGPTLEEEVANKILKKLFLDRGWKCIQINNGRTHIVKLPDSMEEFRKSLGRKFNYNLRKRKKDLGKLGDVEFIRFNNCDSQVWGKIVDDCVSIEQRSWLASDENAEMRISENREFWKHYLRSSDASMRTVVWMITLNGEPISFCFAIDSGDCRYTFSGHYDEKFKKYGVGIISYSYMFEDAIKAGMKIVDMGWGEADYKDRWGAELGSQITDYIYFPPKVIGRLAYLGFKLKSLISN